MRYINLQLLNFIIKYSVKENQEMPNYYKLMVLKSPLSFMSDLSGATFYYVDVYLVQCILEILL